MENNPDLRLQEIDCQIAEKEARGESYYWEPEAVVSGKRQQQQPPEHRRAGDQPVQPYLRGADESAVRRPRGNGISGGSGAWAIRLTSCPTT
ncbi:MAG: hypothetical protein U1F87_08890 [Kiritimatiellia bacterium]